MQKLKHQQIHKFRTKVDGDLHGFRRPIYISARQGVTLVKYVFIGGHRHPYGCLDEAIEKNIKMGFWNKQFHQSGKLLDDSEAS